MQDTVHITRLCAQRESCAVLHGYTSLLTNNTPIHTCRSPCTSLDCVQCKNRVPYCVATGHLTNTALIHMHTCRSPCTSLDCVQCKNLVPFSSTNTALIHTCRSPCTSLDCVQCKNRVPYCVATGLRMVANDWSFCPSCRFPALYSKFKALVDSEKVLFVSLCMCVCVCMFMCTCTWIVFLLLMLISLLCSPKFKALVGPEKVLFVSLCMRVCARMFVCTFVAFLPLM